MGYLHSVQPNRVDADADPWESARDGEVWRWDGERLVPASPDEVALLREQDALRRLRSWERGSRAASPTPRGPQPYRQWTAGIWARAIALVGRSSGRAAQDGSAAGAVPRPAHAASGEAWSKS